MNLVLEALAYLGARANGGNLSSLEDRFQRKGGGNLEILRQRFAPVQSLIHQLDSRVDLPEELLKRLFSNLSGFFSNTSGAYSLALLVFCPMACHCSGDVEEFLSQMQDRTPDQVARDILISLDLDSGETVSGAADRLVDSIISMSLPIESRRALLDAYRNYPKLYAETALCLRKTAVVLRELASLLDPLCLDFAREVSGVGCRSYLRAISGFPLPEGSDVVLRPFFMAPSSNLLMQADHSGSYAAYCGFLRYFLSSQIRDTQASLNRIYQSIRLLGDRTRFDIFCYLLDHAAYGQELSDRFGLARNTIHHHMSKLFDAGLVNCTVEGSRVYYSVDRDYYRSLLDQQRRLLLGD